METHHTRTTRSKGNACAFFNLLVAPGIGSLLAGRYIEGIGQLALCLAGCVFFLVWFVRVMLRFYALAQTDDVAPAPRFGLALLGIALFVIAWSWALFTSIRVWRAGRQGASQSPPPRSAPPRL